MIANSNSDIGRAAKPPAGTFPGGGSSRRQKNGSRNYPVQIVCPTAKWEVMHPLKENSRNSAVKLDNDSR